MNAGGGAIWPLADIEAVGDVARRHGLAMHYAVDHHLERLADDHNKARALAERLREIPGVRLDPIALETNLEFFDTSDAGLRAQDLVRRLRSRGVLVGAVGATRLRAVTHLDVTAGDMDLAARHIAEALKRAA